MRAEGWLPYCVHREQNGRRIGPSEEDIERKGVSHGWDCTDRFQKYAMRLVLSISGLLAALSLGGLFSLS